MHFRGFVGAVVVHKLVLYGAGALVVGVATARAAGGLKAVFLHCRDRILYATNRVSDVDLVMKQALANVAMPDYPTRSNHTHGAAARDRKVASSMAEAIGLATGRENYWVQQSSSDQEVGRVGNRTYYFGKDMHIMPRMDWIGETDILTVIDVDYFMKMNEFLCKNVKPMLMYTIVPSRVAKDAAGEGNYSYTFNEKGEFRMNVCGGSYYPHMLWDYCTDHLVVKWYVMGMLWKVTTWAVERRQVDEEHQLIGLTPTGCWTGLLAWMASFLPVKQLERINPVEGEFLRLAYQTPTGLKVSTGRVGAYNSSLIPHGLDDAISVIARTNKISELSINQIEGMLFELSKSISRSDLAAILEYHRVRIGCRMNMMTHVKVYYQAYTFNDGSRLIQDPKPVLVNFMKPLVEGKDWVPTKTVEDATVAINKRVVQAANNTRLKGKYVKYLREFTLHAIPVPHKGRPLVGEEIPESQPRQSQRRNHEEGGWMRLKRRLRAMLKSESYADPKRPRVITMMSNGVKTRYSAFMKAFSKDVTKRMNFYAFAMTPRELSEVMSTIFTSCDWVGETDYTDYDGHNNKLTMAIEIALLMRWCEYQYQEELRELHAHQNDSRSNVQVTPDVSVPYYLLDGRGSGGDGTADMNSMDNAFMVYCALREQGLSSDEAWAHLNGGPVGCPQRGKVVLGGDDAVLGNIIRSIFEKVAKDCGQVVKYDEVHRNSGRWVGFLGRKWSPGIFQGEGNSCADLMRQLCKLHLSSADALKDPMRKLAEKMDAFVLTDPHSPVLGEFARKLKSFRVMSSLADDQKRESWFANFSSDVQFINYEEPWMYDLLRAQCPEFELEKFRTWLSEVKCANDLLSPPCCVRYNLPAAAGVQEPNGRIEVSAKPVDLLPPPTTRAEMLSAVAGASGSETSTRELAGPTVAAAATVAAVVQGGGRKCEVSTNPDGSKSRSLNGSVSLGGTAPAIATLTKCGHAALWKCNQCTGRAGKKRQRLGSSGSSRKTKPGAVAHPLRVVGNGV